MELGQNGLENGADWSFTSEMELVRKDGSTVWTEITMNVLYDEAGTAKGFMGITRDITERRRAEEEAKRREKLQGVLEMAGAVCHELNQPLQVLMTSIDILPVCRGRPLRPMQADRQDHADNRLRGQGLHGRQGQDHRHRPLFLEGRREG
jgi:hypothetical protein